MTETDVSKRYKLRQLRLAREEVARCKQGALSGLQISLAEAEAELSSCEASMPTKMSSDSVRLYSDVLSASQRVATLKQQIDSLSSSPSDAINREAVREILTLQGATCSPKLLTRIDTDVPPVSPKVSTISLDPFERLQTEKTLTMAKKSAVQNDKYSYERLLDIRSTLYAKAQMPHHKRREKENVFCDFLERERWNVATVASGSAPAATTTPTLTAPRINLDLKVLAAWSPDFVHCIPQRFGHFVHEDTSRVLGRLSIGSAMLNIMGAPKSGKTAFLFSLCVAQEVRDRFDVICVVPFKSCLQHVFELHGGDVPSRGEACGTAFLERFVQKTLQERKVLLALDGYEDDASGRDLLLKLKGWVRPAGSAVLVTMETNLLTHVANETDGAREIRLAAMQRLVQKQHELFSEVHELSWSTTGSLTLIQSGFDTTELRKQEIQHLLLALGKQHTLAVLLMAVVCASPRLQRQLTIDDVVSYVQRRVASQKHQELIRRVSPVWRDIPTILFDFVASVLPQCATDLLPWLAAVQNSGHGVPLRLFLIFLDASPEHHVYDALNVLSDLHLLTICEAFGVDFVSVNPLFYAYLNSTQDVSGQHKKVAQVLMRFRFSSVTGAETAKVNEYIDEHLVYHCKGAQDSDEDIVRRLLCVETIGTYCAEGNLQRYIRMLAFCDTSAARMIVALFTKHTLQQSFASCLSALYCVFKAQSQPQHHPRLETGHSTTFFADFFKKLSLRSFPLTPKPQKLWARSITSCSSAKLFGHEAIIHKGAYRGLEKHTDITHIVQTPNGRRLCVVTENTVLDERSGEMKTSSALSMLRMEDYKIVDNVTLGAKVVTAVAVLVERDSVLVGIGGGIWEVDTARTRPRDVDGESLFSRVILQTDETVRFINTIGTFIVITFTSSRVVVLQDAKAAGSSFAERSLPPLRLFETTITGAVKSLVTMVDVLVCLREDKQPEIGVIKDGALSWQTVELQCRSECSAFDFFVTETELFCVLCMESGAIEGVKMCRNGFGLSILPMETTFFMHSPQFISEAKALICTAKDTFLKLTEHGVQAWETKGRGCEMQCRWMHKGISSLLKLAGGGGASRFVGIQKNLLQFFEHHGVGGEGGVDEDAAVQLMAVGGCLFRTVTHSCKEVVKYYDVMTAKEVPPEDVQRRHTHMQRKGLLDVVNEHQNDWAVSFAGCKVVAKHIPTGEQAVLSTVRPVADAIVIVTNANRPVLALCELACPHNVLLCELICYVNS